VILSWFEVLGTRRLAFDVQTFGTYLLLLRNLKINSSPRDR